MMQQRWQRLAARVDALNQRERVLVFAAVLAFVFCIAQFAVLGPLQRKQDALRSRIAQQHEAIAATNAEIVQKLEQAQIDPDGPLRARLQAVRGETERMTSDLRAM